MRFVDTNVLLYALSTAPEEQEKATRSREILESEDLALSVQVLQELYVQVTRSSRRDRLTHDLATRLVESLLRFPTQETTIGLLQGALETCARYRISYWDAAVIEAARALGCRTLLSEDLQHGADFGGVRVENPYAGLAGAVPDPEHVG